MPAPRPERIDHALIALLLGLALFASPLLLLWARPAAGWFTPYLIWGGLLLAGYLLLRQRDDHDR